MTAEFEKHNALQVSVAQALAQSLASQDWATATLFWSAVGGDSRAWVETAKADSSIGYPSFPLDAHPHLESLKSAMADPQTGAWFSVLLTLTSDGNYQFAFNYDRRVYWNAELASPFDEPTSDAIPTDAMWVAELEAFPRADSYVPEWMRELTPVPAAAAPALPEAPEQPFPGDLAQLSEAWGWNDIALTISEVTDARLTSSDYAELLDTSTAPSPRLLDGLMQDVNGDVRASAIAVLPDDKLERLAEPVRGDASADPRPAIHSAVDKIVAHQVHGRFSRQ